MARAFALNGRQLAWGRNRGELAAKLARDGMNLTNTGEVLRGGALVGYANA